MAWDFSTDPEFQEQLDWMDALVREEIWPMETLGLSFAQLQLAFSSGVHATANLWILVWRAAGDQWELPAGS